ncbi:MAG: hypothetical protein BWY57_00149 [Betaproteobacteria bacterium ADurb.Bin341]|nr:MAG: hypothetical protein BWY57_00149 [Betaproteobacteria bacterium ADurb.Bin341]
MTRRLIVSMLDFVERRLGEPRWNDTVTRLHRPEQKRLEALLLDPHAGWSTKGGRDVLVFKKANVSDSLAQTL